MTEYFSQLMSFIDKHGPGEPDAIRRLPEEVAANIFKYLDNASLMNAARTCRSWRNICKNDPFLRKRIRHYLNMQRGLATKLLSNRASIHRLRERNFLREVALDILNERTKQPIEWIGRYLDAPTKKKRVTSDRPNGYRYMIREDFPSRRRRLTTEYTWLDDWIEDLCSGKAHRK